MKKVLSILLAATLIFAVCVPAFAAELTEKPSQSGDVIIKTSTDDENGDDAAKYVVTIPADTVIPWGQTATDVSYTVESHLTRANVVKVTVAGSGEMATADDAYTLAYALDGATEYTADAPVVYPAATQTLNVLITADAWNYAVVEEYSDVLTYTAELVAA